MQTNAILGRLRSFDTPTVCNGLELIDPQRRFFGYTRSFLHPFNESIGPTVGFAKTATMRSLQGPAISDKTVKLERIAYYKYVAEGDLPKISVVQDLDGFNAGIGPFFGEFNTRIHHALGCAGIVTDGSIRDLDHLPDDILILSSGARPSHSHVHITAWSDQVNVCGMYVSDGDVVHADRHGAVCFPPDMLAPLVDNCDAVIINEAPMIDALRGRHLSITDIIDLYRDRVK